MTASELKTTKIYLYDSLSSVTNHILNRVIYTKDDGKFQIYNGTDYTDMGGSGSGITVCDTSSDLPTDASENDVALTLDKGATYVYTDSAWVTKDLYSNTIAVPVTIGGIEAGTTITEESALSLLGKIIYPEMDPTVGTPSNTLALGYSNNTSIEVGTSLGSLGFNVTFNKSTIAPYYGSDGLQVATSVPYAGDAISYNITSTRGLTDVDGTFTVADDADASGTSLAKTISGKTMTWDAIRVQATTTYGAGSYDAYTSYGNLYESASGGTTASATINLIANMPYYATYSNIDTMTKMGTVTNNNGTTTSSVTIGASGTTGLAGESPTSGRQAILVPENWYTSSTASVKVYNSVSNSIDTDVSGDFTVLSESAEEITINWSTLTLTWTDGDGVVNTKSLSAAPVDTTQKYKLIVRTSEARPGTTTATFSK